LISGTIRGFESPAKAARKPTGQQQGSGRDISGRGDIARDLEVAKSDVLHSGARDVEKLGDHISPRIESSPIQIPYCDAAGGFNSNS